VLVSVLFVVLVAGCAAEEEATRESRRASVEDSENLSLGEEAELHGLNISVDDVYTARNPADISLGEKGEEPEQGKVFVVVTLTVEGTEAQSDAEPVGINDSNFSAEAKDRYRIPKAVPKAFSYRRIHPVYDIVGALPPWVKRTAPLGYEASETSKMRFGFTAHSDQEKPSARCNLGPASEMKEL
jgi:hypothetical protein